MGAGGKWYQNQAWLRNERQPLSKLAANKSLVSCKSCPQLACDANELWGSYLLLWPQRTPLHNCVTHTHTHTYVLRHPGIATHTCSAEILFYRISSPTNSYPWQPYNEWQHGLMSNYFCQDISSITVDLLQVSVSLLLKRRHHTSWALTTFKMRWNQHELCIYYWNFK